MLQLDIQDMIICLLMWVIILPFTLKILRVATYYLSQSYPRFQRYLFKLNRILLALSQARHRKKWQRFYFGGFLLVALFGFYLFYRLLEKILLKQVSLSDSWLTILLTLIIITVALQELRPRGNASPD